MELLETILEWIAHLPPGDLPNPGNKPACPTLQGGSLPEPLGFKILYIFASPGKLDLTFN